MSFSKQGILFLNQFSQASELFQNIGTLVDTGESRKVGMWGFSVPVEKELVLKETEVCLWGLGVQFDRPLCMADIR